MAILSREDYLSRIQGMVGEDTSDEAMSLIEDMTDTYDDMSGRLNDSTDWKSKYEENDKTWREKYKARFFGGSDDTPTGVVGEQKEDVIDDGEEKTFDDLFVEREG